MFKKSLFSMKKRSKREKELIKIVDRLAKDNESWEFNYILDRVKKTFYIVYESLSIAEIDLVINYITKEFYERKKIEINWDNISNKRIVYNNLHIEKIILENIEEFKKKQSKITFRIVANGEKSIINENLEKRLITYNGKVSLEEYWIFKLIDSNWLLDEIKKVNNNVFKVDLIVESVGIY